MNWEDIPQQMDDAFFNKIDEDLDLAFALSLQEEFNEAASQSVLTTVVSPVKPPSSVPTGLGIVDDQWELIDPNPNIHGLFLEFNKQYFYGKLEGVEVRWSPRMTLCAGVCSYEGSGGLCSVRLSLPLLKLRPRRDLVETLLHEMIHAYLFVTANNKDRDAHGPEFLSHMYRINKETGTKITVYHSFHDEVDYLRKHWWKCNGPCQKRRPFFGIVKRAMNRAPGPQDNWWAQHQSTCGGTFAKIKEPEDNKKNLKRKMPQKTKDVVPTNDIKSFFQPSTSKSNIHDLSNTAKKLKEVDIDAMKSIFGQDNLVPVSCPSSSLSLPSINQPPKEKNLPVPFSGQGFTLGSTSSNAPTSLLSKLRKELGYSSLKTPQQKISLQNSKVTASRSNLTNDVKNSGFGTKATSSCPRDSINKASNNAKKGLSQSSLDEFIKSPTSVSKNKNSQELNSNTKEDRSSKINTVKCPVCSIYVPDDIINTHLDHCLLKSAE